jgi:hypothetical protein
MAMKTIVILNALAGIFTHFLGIMQTWKNSKTEDEFI